MATEWVSFPVCQTALTNHKQCARHNTCTTHMRIYNSVYTPTQHRNMIVTCVYLCAPQSCNTTNHSPSFNTTHKTHMCRCVDSWLEQPLLVSSSFLLPPHLLAYNHYLATAACSPPCTPATAAAVELRSAAAADPGGGAWAA